MIRTLLYIPLLFLIGIFGITYLLEPDLPEIDPSKINQVAAKLCLHNVPRNYAPDYFTYRGQIKVKILNLKDKIGFDLNRRQSDFMAKYYGLEEAVICYIVLSGDTSLNMGNSPNNFEKTYNNIAELNQLSIEYRIR